jgi:hypothetical protein
MRSTEFPFAEFQFARFSALAFQFTEEEGGRCFCSAGNNHPRFPARQSHADRTLKPKKINHD